MTKKLFIFVALAIVAALGPALADSDSQQIDVLAREIRALRAEVEKLQKSLAALEALKPTLTTIMPDFAERFHVMHYAGVAGDWALAGHELLELQRLVNAADTIDPEKGALMKDFMTPRFDKLNAAIEHGNTSAFEKALTETVENCNACHAAVGSAFVKVTLDVDESLSMRHSHQLLKSKKPGTHMHKH
ncbi:MAG: hypothetical protein ACE5LB_09975 [Acidiferrobacterales bacterium]